MTYVVTHQEWDNTDLVFWADTEAEIDTWLAAHPLEEYRYYSVYELVDGGILDQVRSLSYEYTEYTGPRVRHKETLPADRWRTAWHRVPIDCYRPSHTDELTVEHPLRVVATSVSAGETQGEVYGYTSVTDPAGTTNQLPFQGCICGTWVEWEGSPEAIAKIKERTS